MTRMVIVLGNRVKLELRRLRRNTADAALAMRCQMVLRAADGRSSRQIGEALGCSRSGVSRALQRFRQCGIAGLIDRREDNGAVKVDEWYLMELIRVLEGRPPDYGYSRPTWTRELLVKVMEERTGVRIHVGTMSRALKLIRARRGRPRPVVSCPWPKAKKHRRLRAIRRVAKKPFGKRKGEVVVYADEVDIHLNPKVGLDWMNYGRQRELMTPGQNEKRYLAGALDAGSGHLTCVEGTRKDSALFVRLLYALVKQHPHARKIHVILDNYRIHYSEMTQTALRHFAKRIQLHFLPPYCPNENKIERTWQDLHAEVTRNHQCTSMDELMQNVRTFIKKRNSRTNRKNCRRAA